MPTHQVGDWDEVTAQWDMEGLVALRDQFHCSEGTRQEDIQKPKSRERTNILDKNLVYFG